MRSAPTPHPSLPLKGRAIAYGGNMYFLLSPRGEEGTHRLGDGKERGSFRRQFFFRRRHESGSSPSPSPSCGAGPPERLSEGRLPVGRAEVNETNIFHRPASREGP